jgi:hypothetical protein
LRAIFAMPEKPSAFIHSNNCFIKVTVGNRSLGPLEHSEFALTMLDFPRQDSHLMTDEDLIKQAYEEFIKNLFKNFYDAYTTSNSSAQEKAAEQIFQNAVKTARDARDRALAILPK